MPPTLTPEKVTAGDIVSLDVPKQTVPTKTPAGADSATPVVEPPTAPAPVSSPPAKPNQEWLKNPDGSLKLHKKTGKPIPKSPGRGAGKKAAPIGTPAEPAAVSVDSRPPSFIPAEKDLPPVVDAEGNPTEPATATPAPAASPDAVLTPEATGDLACRTLYSLTGAFTGDHKAATAKGAEHTAIASNIGAYCKHRGFLFTGTLALIAFIVSYALAEDRRGLIFGKFKQLLTKKAAPKPVEQEPIDIAPASPPRRDPFA